MAKTTKQTKRSSKKASKVVTKPTMIAVSTKGNVLVGKREIEAAQAKGTKLAETRFLFWSQIKYVRAGRTEEGQFVLTTERAAIENDIEVVR